jgi:hypothetical protein
MVWLAPLWAKARSIKSSDAKKALKTLAILILR